MRQSYVTVTFKWLFSILFKQFLFYAFLHKVLFLTLFFLHICNLWFSTTARKLNTVWKLKSFVYKLKNGTQGISAFLGIGPKNGGFQSSFIMLITDPLLLAGFDKLVKREFLIIHSFPRKKKWSPLTSTKKKKKLEGECTIWLYTRMVNSQIQHIIHLYTTYSGAGFPFLSDTPIQQMLFLTHSSVSS